MLAVMGAFLVAALAAPEAFGDHALLFASPTRRALAPHLSSSPSRRRHGRGEAIRRLAATRPGAALLIAAAFLDGDRAGGVWIVALSTDFLGPYVFGVRGFRVSPGTLRRALLPDRDHRPRRVDRRDRLGACTSSTRHVVAAALLGAGRWRSAIWWAYFDVVAIVAERHLREPHRRAPASHRARLLQLPPPADDRRHRPDGAGDEEDARARGRAARHGAGGGAVRRHCALLRRPHRLPAAKCRHPQPAAVGRDPGEPGADPARHGGGRDRRAGTGVPRSRQR